MIRLLELFAGIGSPLMALKNLGVEVESEVVEIDKHAVKSYNAIHNDNVVPTSVVGYEPKVYPDMIFHGSPCQDFSTMGNQRGGEYGSGTRSSLMFETVRIIEKTMPPLVIWENVKGAMKTQAFYDYLEALRIMGYTNSYKVLNANEFGIPQNRERVFIVSQLRDMKFDFNTLKKTKPEPLENFLTEVERPYGIKKSIADLIHHDTVLNLDKTKKRDLIPGNAYTADRYVAITEVNTLRAGGAFQLALKNNEIVRIQPAEYWKLMGFSIKDYELAKNSGVSPAQLYKQAGNSIVEPVLEELLWKIFNQDVETWGWNNRIKGVQNEQKH